VLRENQSAESIKQLKYSSSYITWSFSTY